MKILGILFGDQATVDRIVESEKAGYGQVRLLFALLLAIPLALQVAGDLRDLLPEGQAWAEGLPHMIVSQGKLRTEPELTEPLVIKDDAGRPLLVLAPDMTLPADLDDALLVLGRGRFRVIGADGQPAWQSYEGIDLDLTREKVIEIVLSLPRKVATWVVFPLSFLLIWLMTWILGSVTATMFRAWADRQGVATEKDLGWRIASISQLPAAVLLSLILFLGVHVYWLPLWYLLLSLPNALRLSQGALGRLAAELS
jgi:hypothetical protein